MNNKIKISSEAIKKQKNFWNNCVFVPTDGVEDSWGKRLLDKMAEDKAVQTVRVFSMFEDIVYMDDDGNLAYDFRTSDSRLDYLVEKGFNILIAYACVPPCIALDKNEKTSPSSLGKTRYKGKMLYTSVPKDFKLYENICYEYTKHLIERYGIDVVSKWYLQCHNEPDLVNFFLKDLDREKEKETRVKAYCELYKHFEAGVMRASDKLHIGGPTVAGVRGFLDYFLYYVRDNKLRLDYIAVHNYGGVNPESLYNGTKTISVDNWINYQKIAYMDPIEKCGFSDCELVVDEWGMITCGQKTITQSPPVIARDTEVFSSFYVKLIYSILEKNWDISKMAMCLSGQTEYITEFQGSRSFFTTINYIAKPIYNTFVLAAKLYDNLLTTDNDNDNLFVIPTKNDADQFSVLLTYSSREFKEDIPELTETLTFDTDITGKKVTIWCIDKNTTNPYRMYERLGMNELGDQEIKLLREEAKMKPIAEFVAKESDEIQLKLTPNAVYLVQVI